MSNLQLDYKAVEAQVSAGYRASTEKYRQDDEVEVRTENHRRLSEIIGGVCGSFPHPIRVLDVGCGTGRFFHAVRNAVELVGIDICEEMLEAARSPVLAEEITASNIRLLRGNAYLTGFPAGSFDFIYSLGMFGHGCPVTPEVCTAFHSWLRPGGVLFFNTVDFAGLPRATRIRRRLRRGIHSLAPTGVKARLDERERRCPFFPLTIPELRSVLEQTPFASFRVSSHRCASPLWSGRHLECHALRKAT